MLPNRRNKSKFPEVHFLSFTFSLLFLFRFIYLLPHKNRLPSQVCISSLPEKHTLGHYWGKKSEIWTPLKQFGRFYGWIDIPVRPLKTLSSYRRLQFCLHIPHYLESSLGSPLMDFREDWSNLRTKLGEGADT